jgi:hypothetical protein
VSVVAPKPTFARPRDRSEEAGKRSFDRAARFFNPGRRAIAAVPSVLKVDRLVKNSAAPYSVAWPPSLVITVSGHDHDWQVGEPPLDLAKQLQRPCRAC